MIRRVFILMLASAVLSAAAGLFPAARAGEARASRALSGWFNVTAENGWRGRRYMDGGNVFAEEFASAPSGRIDVWRFYRRGVLTSEERDRNADGKVDFQTRWNPAGGVMESVLRDTEGRGMNDLEIERSGRNGWEIREDRNRDGVTDRVLFVEAPADAFDEVDLAATPDVVGIIPREVWREMWSDDAFSGDFTDYFRYNRDGVLTHRGRWNGREVDWRRAGEPDFAPPDGAGPGPAAAPASGVAPSGPEPSFAASPPFTPGVDPFASGAPAADPYPSSGAASSEYPAQAQALRQRENPGPGGAIEFARAPDGEAYAGLGGGYVDPYTGRVVAAPPPAAPLSVDGFPAGESSARSVPARMRPPGSVRTRRPRL